LDRGSRLLSRDEMPFESNCNFYNLINLPQKKKVFICKNNWKIPAIALVVFLIACAIIISISIIFSLKPTGKNNLSKVFFENF
jgi:uncharacterized protein with PQ loop repeat